MATVRGKCITQLLLLGAIDGIQVCVFISFLCSDLIFFGVPLNLCYLTA